MNKFKNRKDFILMKIFVLFLSVNGQLIANEINDRKEIEKQIQIQKEEIKKEPNNSINHMGLGNLYRDIKEYEKAIDEYRKCAKIEPNSPFPHEWLGNLYYENLNYDLAIKEYNIAISYINKFGSGEGATITTDQMLLSRIYKELSEVYIAQNKIAESKTALEESVKYNKEVEKEIHQMDIKLVVMKTLVRKSIMGLFVVGIFFIVYSILKKLLKKYSDTISQYQVVWNIKDIIIVLLIWIFLYVVAFCLSGILSIDKEGMPLYIGISYIHIILNIIQFGLVVFFVKILYKQSLVYIGISSDKLKKNILIGLSAGILILIIAILVGYLGTGILKFIHIPIGSFPKEIILGKGILTKIPIFILIVTILIAEETLFRGFIYTYLRKELGIVTGIILNSLLYSFVMVILFDIFLFIPCFLIGILCSYLYEKTDSIIPGITANSFLGTIMLILMVIIH